MCGGVKYTDKTGREWAIYFPSPKAALPVLKKDGDVEWVKWGKRKEEAGRFFDGGWARLDSVKDGKWDRYQPVPVQILAQSFMEKDQKRKAHWLDVPTGQAIQGLLAQRENEYRVYVVTEPPPPEYAWIHDRYPRLIKLGS